MTFSFWDNQVQHTVCPLCDELIRHLHLFPLPSPLFSFRLPPDGAQASETISLSWLLLSDAYGSSFLCFTISLYLYFCQMCCLSTLSLLILLSGLPSSRSPRWRGGRVAQSTRGSTHLTYIIICIGYSVSVTCKLWFCCSIVIFSYQHVKFFLTRIKGLRTEAVQFVKPRWGNVIVILG